MGFLPSPFPCDTKGLQSPRSQAGSLLAHTLYLEGTSDPKCLSSDSGKQQERKKGFQGQELQTTKRDARNN